MNVLCVSTRASCACGPQQANNVALLTARRCPLDRSFCQTGVFIHGNPRRDDNPVRLAAILEDKTAPTRAAGAQAKASRSALVPPKNNLQPETQQLGGKENLVRNLLPSHRLYGT